MGLFTRVSDPYGTMGAPAGIVRRAARRLTEPRESSGFVMRRDCPFCEDLFRTAKAAEEHVKGCKG